MLPLSAFALIASSSPQTPRSSEAAPLEVRSPSGEMTASFANGELTVSRSGEVVLSVRNIGLRFAKDALTTATTSVTGTKRREVSQSYSHPLGKRQLYRDEFREATVTLAESGRGGRRFDLIVRAYDSGVAFRIAIPKQPSLPSFALVDETAEYLPSGDPQAYALALPNTNTPYEELYQVRKLSQIETPLIGLPLMLKETSGTHVAILEADLRSYGGLYLRRSASTGSGAILASHISPRLDGSGLAVKSALPHQSPWRVIMAAKEPGKLLESDLVLNLNPPSKIKDTKWIRPGKTLFPWWNGYNTGDSGISPAQTTEYHKWCIDFAASHGIPYHSIDGLDNIAWYGGRIVPYDGGPITQGLPGLDLPEIVRYARSKGVQIRLWMASAATRAQMEKAFPYYEKLGIEGVMIDFFDHDDQETVEYVERAVALAAKHHLTVVLHNIYKPTGLSRTYPNLMTVEGARNLEFDKWDPLGITPEHELLVAYVRGLAGPIDFHAGSFRNVFADEFKPVDKAPMTIGTRSRQLARYVVYEGALPMLADSPAVYAADPNGFDFLKEVPTTWDQTLFLAGDPETAIVMARRKGQDWYIGAMNNSTSRIVDLPLTFLGEGAYDYQIWSDKEGRAPTSLDQQRGAITAKGRLQLAMSPAGGFAIRLTPRP